MKEMRSLPTDSRMDLATVVLPEPVPPATPSRNGLSRGLTRRGSSSGAVSIMGSGLSGLVSQASGDRRDSIRAGSSLTAGAVESAPAGLDDAPYRGAAHRAGLAVAAVDAERGLEISAPALAVHEVVERRAAVGDRL